MEYAYEEKKMKKFIAVALAVVLITALASVLGTTALAATPAELANAFQVGTWPLASGQYDPALDGQGITNGTAVYGLFGADYSKLPDPTSVTGYTQGSSPAALQDGEWYLLAGSSGFNYVLVKGGTATITGGVGNTSPRTGDGLNVAVWSAVAAAAAAGLIVTARRRRSVEQ